MFVARDVPLDVGYAAARPAAGKLVTSGALADASRAACPEGLGSLIRVGPLGDLPGAAKLVRISFLDPADRQDGVRVTPRWEATGLAGGLFPVLDGDFTLLPAGKDAAWLALAGACLATLGRLGASLDRAVLHRAADATVRALLRTVADAVASPDVAPARPGGRSSAGCLPPASRGAGLVMTALRRLAVVRRPELLAERGVPAIG